MYLRCLLAALVGLALLAGCGKKDDLPGQRTLAVFDVPTEYLDKMAEGKSGDTFSPSWWSEPLDVSTTDNPLVAVVEYRGHTIAAGPATNLFHLTWERESDGGPLHLVAFSPDSSQSGDQLYARTAVTPPFSLKKPATVKIGLRLEKHYGMVPDKIRITVRAGLGGNGWIETLFSMQWLLVGAVMLALVVFFRR